MCISTHRHLQIEVTGGCQPIATFFPQIRLCVSSRGWLQQRAVTRAGACSRFHVLPPALRPRVCSDPSWCSSVEETKWPRCPHSLSPPPRSRHPPRLMAAGRTMPWRSAGTNPQLKITQEKRGCDRLALLGVTVRPQPWWPGTAWHGRTVPRSGAGTGRHRLSPRRPARAALGANSRPQSPLRSTRRGLGPSPCPARGGSGDGAARSLPTSAMSSRARTDGPRSVGDQKLAPVGRGRVSVREPAETPWVRREGAEKRSWFFI